MKRLPALSTTVHRGLIKHLLASPPSPIPPPAIVLIICEFENSAEKISERVKRSLIVVIIAN
jgi:hypothetical protein